MVLEKITLQTSSVLEPLTSGSRAISLAVNTLKFAISKFQRVDDRSPGCVVLITVGTWEVLEVLEIRSRKTKR